MPLKNTEDRWLNPCPPGTYSTSACEVVSTMAGSFAVALADRNIAELVKHSTDTIQVGRDDLGSKGWLFNRRMKAQTVWQCVFLLPNDFLWLETENQLL